MSKIVIRSLYFSFVNFERDKSAILYIPEFNFSLDLLKKWTKILVSIVKNFILAKLPVSLWLAQPLISHDCFLSIIFYRSGSLGVKFLSQILACNNAILALTQHVIFAQSPRGARAGK